MLLNSSIDIITSVLICCVFCHSFQTAQGFQNAQVRWNQSIGKRNTSLNYLQATNKEISLSTSSTSSTSPPASTSTDNDCQMEKNRRKIFFISAATLLQTFNLPNEAMGVVTDETEAFANNKSDSAYSPQNLGTATVNDDYKNISKISSPAEEKATDEILVTIPISKIQSAPLGIELADVEFRTNRRVYVKSIMPSSLAAEQGIQTKWVLVSVNGQSTERTNADGVKKMVSTAKKTVDKDGYLQLVFRDNSFQDQLQNLTSNKEAITQVSPSGDTTQRKQNGSIRVGVETSQEDQKLIVSQLVPPKIGSRGAQIDDLLEISYVGKVIETGDIFDGSAIKVNGQGVAGR
jgi:hypothetical protein